MRDLENACKLRVASAGSNILNGGEYGIEASIITTAVLAACLAMIYAFSRAESKKTYIKTLKAVSGT
ncbi:MAG: hypothetical protein K6A80_10840 [Saccharofermentans sp.]|nr:hypothetical protein [Saccharofermentans sp.]